MPHPAWPSRTTGVVLAFLILLAGIQLVIHLSWIARGPDNAVAHLTNDDTFYYLQTAWNLRELGFTTFDGVHATNGVQLLWFWIVAGLAGIVPTKATLLTAVLGACAVLNLGGYVAIWQLGRRLGRPALTVFLALGWLYVNRQHYLLGMENSLHAAVFWFVLVLAAVTVDRVLRRTATRPAILLLTILLCTLVLVRVDSGLYAVLIGGVVFALLLGQRPAAEHARRTIVTAGAIAAGAAALLLASYYAMAGSVLPISGLIKQGEYAWSAETAARITLSGFEQSCAPLTAWHYLLPASARPAADWLTAVALVATAALILANRSYRAALHLRGFGFTCTVLAGATAAHLVYLAGLRDYAIYGVWYLSPHLSLIHI